MALYSLLSGAHYASCSSVLCQWLGKLEQNIEIIEKPQKRHSSLEEAHQRPSAEITKVNPVAHYTVQAWEGQQQVTACSVQKIVEMSLKIMEPERFNSGKSWWCNACENCEIREAFCGEGSISTSTKVRCTTLRLEVSATFLTRCCLASSSFLSLQKKRGRSWPILFLQNGSSAAAIGTTACLLVHPKSVAEALLHSTPFVACHDTLEGYEVASM